MYNLLIIDDEKDEREIILFLLQKFHMDSEFNCFEASNGKIALELIQHQTIDAIITDVKMPFVGGLEVASAVSASHPSIPIIFFSCYNDFSLVKSALSVHAVNYLLKPVDPDEFEKTFSVLLKQLKEADQNKVRQQLNLAAIKNHYLYLLLNKISTEKLISSYPQIDFSFISKYKRLFLLEFETAFFDNPKVHEAEFISCLHSACHLQFDFLNLNSSQAIIFLFDINGQTMDLLEAVCQNIYEAVLKQYQSHCYIAISSSLSRASDFSTAYSETETLLESRFFFTNRHVYVNRSEAANYMNGAQQDDIILNEVKSDIDLKDIGKLNSDIAALRQIFENQDNNSHIYVRFVYSKLIQILYKNLPQNSLNLNCLTQDMEHIFKCCQLNEIQEIVDSIIPKLKLNFQETRKSSSHAVTIIKQYIHSNYNKNITLQSLANMVYLNSSYLSSIFKQETGSGISKYIKSIRMKKAKELLFSSNMKINDICYEVGYTSYSYFIQSFHEYFGDTPEKLRQKGL